MATFSKGFLSQLGQPAMSQSLFNLGSALGSVPGQIKQNQLRKEMAQFDPTTLTGRRGMLELQLQRAKDPQQRLVLGQKISQISKQIEDQDAKEIQDRNVEDLANMIETELEDVELAKLVRSGQVSVSQALSKVKEFNQIKQRAIKGKAAQLNYLRSIGLEDSELMSEVEAGNYEGVNAGSFATLVTNIQKNKKTESLINVLKKRGRKDIANDLELGIISVSQVNAELKSTEPRTTYTNKKEQIFNGQVVFTADVTKPGEDEFTGYLDPETKQWVRINDPSQFKDIPKEINRTDLNTAAMVLAKDPAYTDLSAAEKEQAQLKFSFRVKQLLANKEVNSTKEAYDQAYEEREEFKKDSWWENILSVKEQLKNKFGKNKSASYSEL